MFSIDLVACFSWKADEIVNPADLVDVLSGLEDNNLNTSIYPNPTVNYLKIELDNEVVNGEIVIQDLQGKTIESIEFNGNEIIVQTTNYKRGTYLLTILEGSRVINSAKFVVDN